MDYALIISKEINWSKRGTQQAIELLETGNTIPFIARYRKEATGEMDEDTLRRLFERLEYLKNLNKRKDEVIRLIDEQGKLTPELEKSIRETQILQQVEDIYRPFKPKRRTRASIAKERGLEPLAEIILDQNRVDGDIMELAKDFVNPEVGIETEQDAVNGASDIIAEQVAEDPKFRDIVRQVYYKQGEIVTKGESEEPTPYEMYYEYAEAVRSIPPHRILAINRGEKEEILHVKVSIPENDVIAKITDKIITNKESIGAQVISSAVADGLKRLLFPSLEREIRKDLTERGEEQAIKVFSQNLKNLLLQPPVRGQIVLAIDPGFRTGSKLAVVDETGRLLEIGVMFPHPPQNKKDEATDKVYGLIEKWNVTVCAIGNGTASRETEAFIAELIKEKDLHISYTIVSEAGASVYSASPLAAKEFPDMDLSYRSGVSIARRLQDPLAELVKIDPKSVGVGQYQHDVNPKELNLALKGVVESSVNSVGVELNTASASLLQYVAGLNASVAKAIIEYREKNGKFKERKVLLSVPRLGKQTYQQCAGFIRIAEGINPLENTPVHPESYEVANELLEEIGFSLDDLVDKTNEIRLALTKVDIEKMAEKLNCGLPTLKDIIDALKRPGRDPREDLPPVIFRQDVLSLDDLEEGMILQGTVRNVVDFGAFVDIGVKQDGLVHISQITEKFVKHPMEIVAVGDNVKVAVLGVDKTRGRISLTMKGVN